MSAVAQAARFLSEVRRHPDRMRTLAERACDLDDLVAWGRELGLHFDGPALQSAFRHEFALRLLAANRTRSAGA